jgi:hypothetical protein
VVPEIPICREFSRIHYRGTPHAKMLRRSKRLENPAPIHANSPWSHLPTEITDLIFDALRSTPHLLSNCALVCRFWLPLVWRRLLADITIASPSSSGFFKRLSCPSSSLPEFVTSLQLGRNNFTTWTLPSGAFTAISRLHRLRTLKLFHFVVPGSTICGLSALKRIGTLQRVEIHRATVTFDPTNLFLDMFCALAAHVRSISLVGILESNFPRRKKDSLTDLNALERCALRELELTAGGGAEHFVEWISAQKPVPAIESVSVPPSPMAGKLLETLGASLTRIRLNPTPVLACRSTSSSPLTELLTI